MAGGDAESCIFSWVFHALSTPDYKHTRPHEPPNTRLELNVSRLPFSHPSDLEPVPNYYFFDATDLQQFPNALLPAFAISR